MGNKILIWKKIVPSSEWDIFSPTDFKALNNCIKNNYDGYCPNWGNKLWFQAIISEIDDGENSIFYLNDQSIDDINNRYDLIIYPMANIFNIQYANNLLELANLFSKIKIPVYIIACGAQANNYDCLDELINAIGDNSKTFIDKIYSTGGEFALRGNFTKEFFDRLGYSTAVVTGCPSLYQKGRNFSIDNYKVSENEINPSFNGNINYLIDLFDYFSNSVYFDQDLFFNMLYDPDYYIRDGFFEKLKIYKNFGVKKLSLLRDKRIKQFPNMNDWYLYFRTSGINYSFGSRIHGSIMPILAGVPSTVIAIDSRTQEMAEFYDIPFIKNNNKIFKPSDVIEAYYNADYSNFNKTYPEKFMKYEEFLIKNKIVKRINDNNTFFSEETLDLDFDSYYPNSSKFQKLINDFEKSKFIYGFATKIANIIQ